jgi:photosystem II stability/assembly factor-like uncharacterized protein
MVKNDYSPYKSHAGWFIQSACHGKPDAQTDELEKWWASRTAGHGAVGLQWECVGPFNIAGRVVALLVHPGDPQTLYAGAAAGGVWRSHDGGLHWESCWPAWCNPNIGALAFDPADPQTVFCATGEANISPDAYPGSGLLVSHDGGTTWTALAGGDVIPRRIGALHPDPWTPGRLLLGGVTLDASQPSGLYESRDGGKTWQRDDSFSLQNYWCHSITCHPDGPLFAAVNLFGSRTGIWRRDRNGWRHLNKGLPAGDSVGRISLASAPSRPDRLYALAASRGGNAVAGVYRSDDRGESWEPIGGQAFAHETQASYNNTIAVHPTEPDIVACGLTDIYISRDGGTKWVHASSGASELEFTPGYVHYDQHALVFAGAGLLYAACDGGVFLSQDLGLQWQARAHGMCNTMFYGIDVAPHDARLICGGAQDNGSLLGGAPPTTPGEFLRVVPGDGAWTVFDDADPTRVITSTSSIRLFRHTAAEHWTDKFWKEVTPNSLPVQEHHQVVVTMLAIDPAHPNTVWFGSDRLWRTTDDGDHWEPVTHIFDGSSITAIEIPPAAPDQVWVGTRAGGIFRSLNRGQTWSQNLAGPEVPPLTISRIESHPDSARTLVVTVKGSGAVVRLQPGAEPSTAGGATHVFCSEDGGDTWHAIGKPDMPDVPYHAAVFEPRKPYRLFVANDCGVWMTADRSTWLDVSGNLPSAMVSDLVYHHREHALIAATYGRGIWRAKVPQTGPEESAQRQKSSSP